MTVPQLPTDQKTATTMDFGPASDTQSTIGLVDYNPSMYSKSGPYSLKLAKMVSITLLGMTAILGAFMLMTIYVQGTSRGCSCSSEQRAESRNSPYYEPLQALTSEDTAKNLKRLPIRIQMDGEAGELMRKNRKGHVNCAVERKTATQIIASEPKMLVTPYGNITTDPRIIHMTGEKMIFSCSTRDKQLPSKRSKVFPYRKYSSLIKLNALDNKTPTSEAKESRPKRSTYTTKNECACDCAC